jgi:ABC-type proline/glycine betaine transport system permease subunit
MNPASPRYTLNIDDVKSIGITLAIVAGSAIVAQLLVLVPLLDFGKNTVVITLVLVTVLKAVQKFIDGLPQKPAAPVPPKPAPNNP